MGAVIGIDPGKSGAVAIMNGDEYSVYPMPKLGTEIDWTGLYMIFAKCDFKEPVAYLEKVHAIPGSAAGSMFSFGGVFHGIQACLQIAGIPYELVTPKDWQAVVFKGQPVKAKGKERKKALKDRSIAHATKRFPNAEIGRNDNKAEALCIALYGMQRGT